MLWKRLEKRKRKAVQLFSASKKTHPFLSGFNENIKHKACELFLER